MIITVEPSGRTLPVDGRRGTIGMFCVIATEALLFVVLFFAYFYLGHDKAHWPPEPPRLAKALAMLAVLLSSSVVLYGAERSIARPRVARLAIGATLLLGAVFLALQSWEYHELLKKLRPSSGAYASIFYTVTSIHGAHLMVGILMLAYVLLLPSLDSPERPPHRPLHNAALYWHFVDIVWVVIVAVIYVLPHWR